jgi:hypothetical protein
MPGGGSTRSATLSGVCYPLFVCLVMIFSSQTATRDATDQQAREDLVGPESEDSETAGAMGRMKCLWCVADSKRARSNRSRPDPSPDVTDYQATCAFQQRPGAAYGGRGREGSPNQSTQTHSHNDRTADHDNATSRREILCRRQQHDDPVTTTGLVSQPTAQRLLAKSHSADRQH